MRQIKFRAWDIKRNAWGYQEGVATAFPHDIMRPDTPYQVLTLNREGIDLMQYTGLKDKNGIEIYEGDIIFSSHVEDNKAGSVKWSDIHHAYIIDYPRRRGDATDQWQDMHGKEHCYEVIGNIYETPELMKKGDV